jgi:hypothetical protein
MDIGEPLKIIGMLAEQFQALFNLFKHNSFIKKKFDIENLVNYHKILFSAINEK